MCKVDKWEPSEVWERGSYDYDHEQKVLKKHPKPDKLGLCKEGPYIFDNTQVHTDGNLYNQCVRPGVTEMLNIRRVHRILQGTNTIPRNGIMEGKRVVSSTQPKYVLY